MKKRAILFALVIPAIFLLVAGSYRRITWNSWSPEAPDARRTLVPVSGSPGFAVVELYTSEGCSSCPPADEVLARIAADYKDNVYVMGFHVDYWDRLGWKDAYSNAVYTRRQQEYGRVLRLSSIYTPQVIVNGEKEMVGSEEKNLRSVIAGDLKRPGGKKIILQASSDGASIKVNYQVADRGGDVLYIALLQSHAETKMGAGENNGRRLQHINIVRDLQTAAAGDAGSVNFALPQGLKGKDCKLIAFLQRNNEGSLSLTGATGADI